MAAAAVVFVVGVVVAAVATKGAVKEAKDTSNPIWVSATVFSKLELLCGSLLLLLRCFF